MFNFLLEEKRNKNKKINRKAVKQKTKAEKNNSSMLCNFKQFKFPCARVFHNVPPHKQEMFEKDNGGERRGDHDDEDD